MHPSRKVYHYRKQNENQAVPAAPISPELKIPESIKALWEQKKVLQKKIHEIDNRLRFGYSEALYDYKVALIRDDVILACQINAILLSTV
ncbi:MAG: hypothetical protein NTV32_05775 [Gammaproteobacteria bacterium]|jgi:hypothetical protein|nr:hypothetical protein [Gammaproteobacteria bacterium]